MAEFQSMRASVTGSAVPTSGFSYGSEHKKEEPGTAEQGATTPADVTNLLPDDAGGNTVTFGGVETYSTAGSTVTSTDDGKSAAGTNPRLSPLEGQASSEGLDSQPTLPPIEKSEEKMNGKSAAGTNPRLPPLEGQASSEGLDSQPTLPPIEKSEERMDAAAPKINVNPDVVKTRESVVTKEYMNAVVIGHLASGKSTVSGRLVYECDGIDEELMTKFEREANQAGKSSSKYAWIMDKLQVEREKGVSIDTKLRRLETRHYYVNVIDAPGHTEYVHNMITGSSQADVAVLVVSAKDGDFEAGVTHDGQTREHLLLAYTMGVKQLIVAVNKMDVTKPPYSQKRYNFVVQNIDLLAKKAGFEPESVVYLPISGWKGDNLVKRSENLNWFKMWQIERKSGGASGRTLLDALDSMERPMKMERYPLRVAVHSVYKLGSVGVVAAGKIHTGFVKPGMEVTFGPSDIQSKVRAVQLHHDAVTEGQQGENVGLQIEGLDIKDVRKGFLVGEANRDPPKMVTLFTAQMVIIQHPSVIKKGYTPMIHCHTACVPVKFLELRERSNRRTGGQLETNPSIIKAGDACVVDLVPTKPICVESFFDYPTLGRFVLRDHGKTVACGVVVDIPGRDPPQTDDDKWATEVPFSRRPQTTGGRSVSFSIPQPGEFDKPSKNMSMMNDEPTFRTQSGKLETEL